MPLLSTAVSFQAQITGAPENRAYPWVEVVDADNGGKIIPPNPRYGTYSKNPAYEANQNTTIPIGKVVMLWPGYNDIGGVGMDYRFFHPCTYAASASGSGSGSGSGSASGSHSGSTSKSGSASGSAASSHFIVTTTGCPMCVNGAAAQWTLTTSGISNNICTTCNEYNGTWVLPLLGPGGTSCCGWQQGYPGACNGNITNDTWAFATINNGDGTWTVQLVLEGKTAGLSPWLVTWSVTITAGSWDCKSPITLSLVGTTPSTLPIFDSCNFYTTSSIYASPPCANWPSSITVNPV